MGQSEVALRQKEFGIWREFSWQESCEQVRNFGLGLREVGLARGDHVATIGDNDRQYLWAYLGLQAVGGVQVGLFTDATAEEAAYIIDHSDARFVLAQDQEQVDKMLAVREQIPKVERVVYWDERGLWEYEDPWLVSYEEVCRRGEGAGGRGAVTFRGGGRAGARQRPGDTVLHVGDDGPPQRSDAQPREYSTVERRLCSGGHALRQR